MKKPFLTFYDYWINFGKLEDEVTKSNPNLELIFYKFGEKVWREANGSSEEACDCAHCEGFDLGEETERKRVLEILTEQNKLTPELEKLINIKNEY